MAWSGVTQLKVFLPLLVSCLGAQTHLGQPGVFPPPRDPHTLLILHLLYTPHFLNRVARASPHLFLIVLRIVV
jgi:hypothetical protein